MADADVNPLSLQEKLIRYLRTGTEGSFFLPGKNKVFRMFGNVIKVMIEAGQGPEAVECIKRVNAEKSYLKREPLLYFLAVATHSSNEPTKKAAYIAVNEVCENPVDLFTWLKHVKDLSQLTKGWGAGLRKTVTKWYHSRDPMLIAEFVTRYVSVGRWHHKDVFRLSHMKPENDSMGFIIKVVCKGLKAAKEGYKEPSEDIQNLIAYFDGVDFVKHSDDSFAVAMKMEELGLHRQHIPVALLSSKEIWNSLLLNMSVKDVMSNLPALARRAFLTIPAEGGDADKVVKEIQSKVLTKIKDSKAIEQEKISPFFIYIAIRNYVRVFSRQERREKSHKAGSAQKREAATNTELNEPTSAKKKKKKKMKKERGEGDGESKDKQNEEEANATEKATKNNPDLFESMHSAFKVAVEKNLPCTGKRYLIAVKASVSELGKGIRGTPSISALEVMALMATFYKKKEKSPDLGFFTASLTHMNFPKEMENIIAEIGQRAAPVPNLACDPAAPITWALEKKRKYDAFILLSDGTETHGEVRADDKLQEYREKMNLPDTKMVLCGLNAPRLDFAKAAGMLDIGGFDATVPEIIYRFITDQLDH
ncbi:RNA-binding protein RO60-like [Mercenaria mercenaria]|uniref:RNA-binding protein RO60-like n=1 Tax=Mercenaria mercenaria TaxID=6596 RepID=UPI00234F3F24|nr:RNA-binding protein RO60-like [Mercenaria mercenaria]XP_045201416.2 RNA-binding protein RO60-like [Mercenaria mercenaria]